MSRRGVLCAIAALAAPGLARGAETDELGVRIQAYLRPYLESGNFAGVVRVERAGAVSVEQAFGVADPVHGQPNRPDTQFHVASMSMQYTAAAVMRLVDQGTLTLDMPAAAVVGPLPGFEKVTIRHLLTETSGLPDINDFADYPEILQHHQTPRSLVDAIAGKPLLFEPGTKVLHEEHSAYNLLALIIETKSRRSFREALEALVFRPLGMRRSGADDDGPQGTGFARGQSPDGVYRLKPTEPIHWSAMAGSGSAYVTAEDQCRWVRALFKGGFLSATSQAAILDTSQRVGFGWSKLPASPRFGGRAYVTNGHAPGFASIVLHLPDEDLTVVALSNIYVSSPMTIGYDIADLARGKTVVGFSPQSLTPSATALAGAAFRFGADFYQPNSILTVVLVTDGLGLDWGGGQVTPLIPVGEDRFIDRAYWTEMDIQRAADGRAETVLYGGRQGQRVA